MANAQTTHAAPAADVPVVNARPHTLQLAWNVRPESKLEPVGGVAPMQPLTTKREPLRPGLNYIPAASLDAAAGKDRDKLPRGITVESPLELRGRYCDEVIESSTAPALRRWLGEEKRADVREKIAARLETITSRRAAVA